MDDTVTSASGEGLTVAEAAAVYGTSVSTVRRLLTAGRLEGARRVPGPKGAEYRIPPASLEALGYRAAVLGPATVRSEVAEAELERLRDEMTMVRTELESTRHGAALAEQKAGLVADSLDDLRTAIRRLPDNAAPAPARTTWPWRWMVTIGAVAALTALFLRGGCARVTTDDSAGAPAPAAVTVALTSEAPATVATSATSTEPTSPTTSATSPVPSTVTSPPGTDAPTTAPPITVTPTTVTPTTVTPTTVTPTTSVAPTTTVGREAGQVAYFGMSWRWNAELDRIHRTYPIVDTNSVRTACAQLEATYHGFYTDLSAQPWPVEAQDEVDALVLASANLEQELHRCSLAASGEEALAVASSADLHELFVRESDAATATRLALGLPATRGEDSPDGQL